MKAGFISPSSCLEIIRSAPRNARHVIGALRSKVDGWPGDGLILRGGVFRWGGYGERNWSLSSLY